MKLCFFEWTEKPDTKMRKDSPTNEIRMCGVWLEYLVVETSGLSNTPDVVGIFSMAANELADKKSLSPRNTSCTGA